MVKTQWWIKLLVLKSVKVVAQNWSSNYYIFHHNKPEVKKASFTSECL